MIQVGNIEQCLQELGYAVVPIRGTSMWPLLKEGKSRVQVEAKEGKQVRKGDIVLYRRKDGTLVLHRIIKSKVDSYGLNRMCPGTFMRPAQLFNKKNSHSE